MTLCTAALARGANDWKPNYAIIGSDMRVETDVSVEDQEIKYVTLTPCWTALVGGTLSLSRELAGCYRAFFKRHEELGANPPKGHVPITEDSVLKLLYEPLDEMRERLREHLVQKELSVSLRDYRENQHWFSDEVRRATDYDLLRLDFDAPLILVGLIDNNLKLFRVHAQSHIVEPLERFGCIGTGTDAAEMILRLRKYSEWWGLPRALYAVYEAHRVSAQVSPRVSKERHIIYILGYDKTLGNLYPIVQLPEAEKYLEERFNELGPKPVPMELDLPEGGLYDVVEEQRKKAAQEEYNKAYLEALGSLTNAVVKSTNEAPPEALSSPEPGQTDI